eukprot:CAMPEP_0170072088 /NCGR_PEP_ID=MMETSP0019_2-20121128/9809_1 /TAXON_ID=98059 /ORGANISM="Dinobryon sp., Strain UTEXLB2267" /LENGTH=37 /DNA_ID= /DNA_START= /DNA_END= /DNA_ORIENTATION=
MSNKSSALTAALEVLAANNFCPEDLPKDLSGSGWKII